MVLDLRPIDVKDAATVYHHLQGVAIAVGLVRHKLIESGHNQLAACKHEDGEALFTYE